MNRFDDPEPAPRRSDKGTTLIAGNRMNSISNSQRLGLSRKHIFRALAFAAGAFCIAIAASQVVDPSLYKGLVWRNIGPFRAGRVSAVSGAVGEPGVFYMGLPAGGVWKTTDAGNTWYPIFDHSGAPASVGAVAVAPSDPNVTYVGMGDMFSMGGSDKGNGVYKSTDAGKTWTHLGLSASSQIQSILVDPHNPDLVMVAAQGSVSEPSIHRGVYRSTDGGQTWTKTLFVNDKTGAQRIAWASDDPDVMLATTDLHVFPPVQRRFGPLSGKPGGSALYKSTDEGMTWTQITGGGLPVLAGRTCVAVAMGTNAQRMFLIGGFGLYRSDDGGVNWRRMDASDTRIQNGQGGYNCGVYVNSQNPNIVYVVNTCSYISKDGGTTFTGFKGAPGGDDPQQMWIDPNDGNRLFFGVDQGATISLNGGKTWSSWYNQPTAQVYHIGVTNTWPYWVYATQQDSCSVATLSRGILGEITPLDWRPVPTGEFGYILPDPLNANIIYCGSGGGLDKVTYPSGQRMNVSPSLDPALKLHGGGVIVWSQTNLHELYDGFQCLMSTVDGGVHWHKLSPDLTRTTKAPAKKGPAPTGPAARFAASISAIAPSSVNGNEIWAGTSNGLIWLTKDHGATWSNVSIASLPTPIHANLVSIDASHQNPAEAYAAVDLTAAGDYGPHLFRTVDYGASWTEIDNGLPTKQADGSFARVIKCDTKKSGLLFLGTNSDMYVSFDDGNDWQSLMLNMPTTEFSDMVVHGNDLIVGTYGRSFWVLDDMSPLRQITPDVALEPAHLFKPGTAIRIRRDINGDTPFPPEVPHALNAPPGALIYYYLGQKPTGIIKLTVTDSKGREVRTLSSAPIPPFGGPPPPIPNFWMQKLMPMPTSLGTNRINWDLRYDSPPSTYHGYGMGAIPGLTPPGPQGPMVVPGVYTLTLTVDGKSYTQDVTVKNDPNSPATIAEIRAEHALQMKLYYGALKAWRDRTEVAALRQSVDAVLKSNPSGDLHTAAAAFDKKLAAVEGTGGRGGFFFGGFRRGGPPAAPNFSMLAGMLTGQSGQFGGGDMAPTEYMRKGCDAVLARLQKAAAMWETLKTKDLSAFNDELSKHGLSKIASQR